MISGVHKTDVGDVTLSVVSHCQRELLRQLLDDLVVLQSPRVKRVIVTLNTKEPFEPSRSADFELLIRQNETPMGFGANHNRAFALCDTEIFVVANPDVRLSADPFPVLARALMARAGIAAPAVRARDGRLEDSARRLLTPIDVLLRRLGWRRTDFERPAWVAGMFIAFRADLFKALGGFDEKFHMYCEDADICARAAVAGSEIVYCADAVVIHEARRASRRALRPLFWHARSLLKFWVSPAFWSYHRFLTNRRRAESI